ncbi:MAG: imidazoleglycerol-phosphate dehydratase HisB [Armatimonadaceae bacterium]
MNSPRTAEIERVTSETRIALSLRLDGDGASEIQTGVGFFDHMLTHVARHGLLSLRVAAAGDLHIDDHHTVEDVGIVLGQALRQAVGDKSGLARYGDATVPMDESLVLCALDFSGRGQAYVDLEFSDTRIGNFATELVEEFFHAVARSAGLTLHVRRIAGTNAHHVAEAAFKAFGRALRAAVAVDPRVTGIPSTKGSL